VGVISGNDYDAAWIVPLDVGGCFRNPIRPIPGPIIISRLSIGYELVTPDPLAMKNGVYTGDLMLSVGPHADFDFGDRATVSDTEVHVRFTLTVVHDFKITRPDAAVPVILQPKGGWEHADGRVPGGLEGELPVLISSSAPFGITLQCEHRSGEQCGIQSENDGSNVPVVTSITAPGLQNVGTKIAAYRHELSPLHREAFETSHGYVADRPSRIHFNVPGESTEIMLKQPGSRWRGDITLIFDSQL
jgi:hypothetical protein